MILVLCGDGDPSAVWAARGLRLLGAEAVVVTAAELVCALRVVHTVDDGGTRLQLDLPLGRSWTGRDGPRPVRGILNRLADIPVPTMPGLPAEDRAYAREELRALTTSWLSSLAAEGVAFIGKPHPAGFAGEWRYPTEWAALASAAGLGTRPFALTPDRPSPAVESDDLGAGAGSGGSAVVLCGQVFGTAPPERARQLALLASLADADTLGVQFDVLGRISQIGLLPDLRVAGAAGLTVLTGALSGLPVGSRSGRAAP
ncbi:hypothetical protein GCM10027449_17830 [Sinomonas notoginsengisoli]|uniref:hypothetical protein n=1 Tax=Sinomonas notoginsengisoli TaxID=1457311 RepID=UPI001F1A689F|nr:hypothetical protein [Sinomonas notoginsengisoli]